jgi:hypothetical protein
MRKFVLAIAAILASTLPVLAGTPSSCTTEIQQVVARTFSSGPYEVTTTLTSLTGDYRTVTKVVPGVGLYARTQLLPTEDADELLALDGKVWRNSGVAWVRVPVSPLAYREMTSATILDVTGHMVEPRCLGIIEREGHRYLVYGFTDPDQVAKAEARIWVDAESRHTSRIEIDMTIAGDASHIEALFRYDPAITITVPAGADLTNDAVTSIAPRR